MTSKMFWIFLVLLLAMSLLSFSYGVGGASGKRDGGKLTSTACPTLPKLSNGSSNCYVANGSNSVSCAFSCNDKYHLSGSKHRKCLSNGTWTGIPAKCDKITCFKLPALENGQVMCSDGIYAGSDCHFSCNDGRLLVGSEFRSCDSYGWWSGSDTSCHACPPLPVPKNGLRQSCSLHANKTVYCESIRCELGYRVSVNGIRSCLSNGSWTGYPAKCDKITSCTELPVPINGGKSCTTGNKVTSECSFTCNDGYQLYGSNSRFCDDDGSWSGLKTLCQDCLTLPTPINGGVTCNTQLNNTVSCMVSCHYGYHGSGDFEKTCLSNGSWSGNNFTCERKFCPELTVTENLQKRCTDGNNIDSTCDFKCKDGFELLGSKSRRCILFSGWSGSNTFCRAIPCPSLPAPNGGSKICSARGGEKVSCTFSCNYGYQLYGNQLRSCLSNGSWTGYQTTCSEITSCLDLEFDNGETRCTKGNVVSSYCRFNCNDGYELFGGGWRLCQENGEWGVPSLGVIDPELMGYPSCQDSSPTPTCNVAHGFICNGAYECSDKSDEKGCICPRSMFKCDCYETGCPSLYGCIKLSQRCDGNNDCGDGSDERDCHCSDTRFQCKQGDCIERSKVNDGKIDCEFGDDEFHCNTTLSNFRCGCLPDDDQCLSSGRCIPSRWVGDTIPDCANHSDEPCNASKVWCEECWIIINQCSTKQSRNIYLQESRDDKTKCYNLTVFSEQNQKLEIHWICMTSPCGKCLDMFRCTNGQVIDNRHYCDTISHCNDNSDEDGKQFGFRCSGKSKSNTCVLPQRHVYDSVAHCADSSDLCFVNGEFRCFSCLDGRLIVSANQVCDGIVDCYDVSDECLCANQSVCNAVLGSETSRCPSQQMPCCNNTDCVDMDEVLCDSSVDCKGGRNRMFCHQDQRSSRRISCYTQPLFIGALIRINAALCDGRPECSQMEDECTQCQPRPLFCDQCMASVKTYGRGSRVCDGYINNMYQCDITEKNCPMRFACRSKDIISMGMISIDIRSVCDGIYDCDDHSDENNTDCYTKRFYCENGNAFSIDKTLVCDGMNDCDNSEDEARKRCDHKRFYCDNGEPISIDRKLLENGIKDCTDGSDECISLFSNRYEMIANPLLRALFWIMGLLALSGNILVSMYTAKDALFSKAKANNSIKLANDIFILNLTISDFMMGVYLIIIVSQGVKYSGSYCLVDKVWRSSSFCSGLGTLAVLSSETSAFIMAAMSTFRLVTVYKPFLSKSIKIKWIVFTGCSCWIASILLAIVPWFPFVSGYFISDVWFPNVFLKTDVVSKADMFTLAKRVFGNSSDSKSWFTVKEIISSVFKYNPIKGEFGYYGETSVCMPRIYSSTKKAAWEYSTFLITLNFVLFIYMVGTYVLVYNKATGMKQSRSAKKDPNRGMRKRISRLLLTDFCCWIPICIMEYLSVAGVSLSPNAYLVTAGFLLPVNSSMNPILYSKFIGRLVSRSKKWVIRNVFGICSRALHEVRVVHSSDSRTDHTELRVIEVKTSQKNVDSISTKI